MTTSQIPIAFYHYTSIRGLEGVLTKKEVWASLLHFMNDSREWLYALDLVKEGLHKKLTLRNDSSWLQFIAEVTTGLSRIENLNIAAFSLTPMPNQLSQWRAYCPPEGGYNLMFRTEELKAHLDGHRFEFEPCIYDEVLQRKMVDDLVEEVLNSVGAMKNDDSIIKMADSAVYRLSQALCKIAPLLKHPDFREEEEWRAFSLVYAGDPRMVYHIKGAVAIPHCSLNLEAPAMPFPIVQITVGPNVHQMLALRGVATIQRGAALSLNIIRSLTPLRNL